MFKSFRLLIRNLLQYNRVQSHACEVPVGRVFDGDSFKFTHPSGGPGSARLYGIDAPECAYMGLPEQPGSREARDRLRELLGKRCDILILGSDSFNRSLVIAWPKNAPEHQGRSVNEILALEGLAWSSPSFDLRHHLQKEIDKVHLDAITQERGLWEGFQMPMPPAGWRMNFPRPGSGRRRGQYF